MNGLLTVVDAIFLGVFVGADGLTAVTMMFPISMLLVAVAAMISTGMASELGWLLGAGNMDAARPTFAGAHGLSIPKKPCRNGAVRALRLAVVALMANGSSRLASMGHVFLAISVLHRRSPSCWRCTPMLCARKAASASWQLRACSCRLPIWASTTSSSSGPASALRAQRPVRRWPKPLPSWSS